MKQDTPASQEEKDHKWYRMYLLLISVLAGVIMFFVWFTKYFS
ncbi:hypothetical protein ACTHGU_07325 [Chitinophagaceae bacterium MMS25-I14]